MAGVSGKLSSTSSTDQVPGHTRSKQHIQGDNVPVPVSNAKKNRTEQRVGIASSLNSLNTTGDVPRRPLGRKTSNPLNDKPGENVSHKDHQVIKVSKSSDEPSNVSFQSERPSQELAKRGSKDHIDASASTKTVSQTPLRRSSSLGSQISANSKDQSTLRRQNSVHERGSSLGSKIQLLRKKTDLGPIAQETQQTSTADTPPKPDLSDLLVKARARRDSGASTSGLEDPGSTQGRRPSLTGAAEPPPKGRFTFLSVTQRVNNLLRVRKALLPSKPRADSIEEENVISATEVVQNLPKTPRFSSFMSAEAQFALMKGYEDLLREKLEKDHQDDGVELRRNKTPHHKVSICDKTEAASNAGPPRATGFGGLWRLAKRRAEDEEQDSSPGKSSTDDSQAVAETSLPAEADECDDPPGIPQPSESHSGGRGFSQEPNDNPKRWAHAGTSNPLSKKESGPILENLRRMSLSFPTNTSKIGQMGVTTEDTRDRRPKSDRTNDASRDFLGSNARKSALTHTKRLVLSYRLESAMDILDQIKPECEHTLSPRVKSKEVRSRSQNRQVTEYNKWTAQWANEFTRHAVN